MLILNLSGNIGVASYGVIANISSVCSAIFSGLAQGVQPLMSHSYGKRDSKMLKKYLQYGIVTSLIFATLIIFFVNYKSDFFIALFNSENNAGLHASATEGIALYFWAFIFGGVNTLLVSYFSATNNPKPAFLSSLIRGTFAIVFFALLLSSIWKMVGVWLAFPCSEAFSFLVILYYYKKEIKENSMLKA